ncbi:MAG: response regulator [Ilumatobacteraceae bacterium]
MTPAARTVLYVEDDALNRELMTHIAALVPDCRLLTAPSLLEARTVLHDLDAGTVGSPVALVMVDLDLPDGDGADLLGELRVAPAPPTIWVVTGDAAPGTADRLRALGVAAVVVKPFDVSAIVDRLTAELAG